MASKHDIKGRQIQIEEIISIIIANPILISSLLRYKNANTFADPQDIVDKNYVDNAISNAGSGITSLTFVETDLLDAGGGDWYLPYSLSGGGTTTPVPLVIYVVYGGTTVKSLPLTYNQNGLYGFQDPSLGTQTILLKIG